MSITTTDSVPKRKTISPYDLTSGDNPGAVISQPLLNGLNYDEWAINLRMALSSRKKFGFIDGSIPKPEANSSTLEDWVANNHLLVGWIKLTIEPKLRSSISTREVARDLWEIIRKRFSVKSGARLQQLRNALASCKQQRSSVDDYFGRLTKLWDGIAECTTTKRCECGKCTCDLNTARDTELEVLKVHDFLSGLDDDVHGAIRSQICAITPLPDLDTVYQTVVQNETIRSGVVKDTAVMSFASQASSSLSRQYNSLQQRTSSRLGSSNRDPSRVCKACGRNGHEAASCFKVVGYPEWWEDRNRVTNNNRSTTPSSNGRGRGQPARANSSQIVAANSANVNQPLTDTDRQGLVGLTDEQWRTIQRVLSSPVPTDRLSGKHSNVSWIIDTGATHHMTGCADLFHDLHSVTPVSVQLPSGTSALSYMQSTIILTQNLCLKNVYLVPGFNMNLLSCGQLLTDNHLVGQVTDRLLIFQDRTSRILIGAGDREREGLYRFREIETVAANHVSVRGDSTVWHLRLGHASSRIIDKLPGVKDSLSIHDSDLSTISCDVCLRAKQTRQCFPDSLSNAKEIFDLVHCDLWGPYRTPAFCGSRYFLTLVDDCSRAVWLYLLPDKSSVSTNLQNFLRMIERQFSKKVKKIRSDNGTEFLCMTRFFKEEGIIHETSCVYTPQQNGRVERKHRHILEVARALRFQAGLPVSFWGECTLTASYLINRTPSQVLHGKTPFEILYGHPPSYKHLRVFGCLAHAHNLAHKGDKFASRSRRCAFVGYPYGKKGWRLYDLDREIFFVSRDVVFDESVFPYSENQLPTPTIPSLDASPPVILPADADIDETLPDESPSPNDDDTSTSEAPSNTSDNVVSSDDMGRGKRPKTRSSRLTDYIVGTVTLSPLSSLTTSSSDQLSSGTDYPLSNYLSAHRFSPAYCSYLVALTTAVEPRSFREAMTYDEWREAMKSEVTSLEDNETWELTDLPPGKKCIGSQWVFRVKLKADGTLERYKARLVALGNHQAEGLDYKETFAPVAKLTTVRLLLDVAAKRNYEVHQMDVHNAFLHGDLEEEVYMRPPPGFTTPGDKRVCRLRKSIYGLKQSPRCWFAKLADSLLKYGFKQSRSDYSLFMFHHGGISVQILVYVDDLMITGNSPSAIQEFKDYLSTCFHMKDLGQAKYFLGLEIARSSAGIYLCQRKYAIDIVTEAGLLGCKPAGSPIDQNHQLALAKSPPLANPEKYRRLVGRLIYLSSTRPDLSYAIHILSQFMQKPKEDHWLAALKCVRYLKGTLGQGVLLKADSPLHLTGWCDSDWASCPLTRKSLTGWIVQFGDSPISWKTKKQKTVSCSSAEAEYRAMAAITRELRWLKALLLDLGINHKDPMSLRCDSQAALHISANPVFHERTKHIEVDCHYVRDNIVAGFIKATHVSTKAQLADILTKALGRKEFESFLLKLGIQDLYAPT